LVSPAVYAESTAAVSDARRLRAENGALTRLRVTERQAAEDLAQACRARVGELAAERDRAGRLSTLRGVALFVAGVTIGALASLAFQRAVPN